MSILLELRVAKRARGFLNFHIDLRLFRGMHSRDLPPAQGVQEVFKTPPTVEVDDHPHDLGHPRCSFGLVGQGDPHVIADGDEFGLFQPLQGGLQI
jgi:hypothetical protein